MLHPFVTEISAFGIVYDGPVDLLVSLGEVFSGVGTSRLLSGSGRNDCLNSVLHDVSKLKSLDQVAKTSVN